MINACLGGQIAEELVIYLEWLFFTSVLSKFYSFYSCMSFCVMTCNMNDRQSFTSKRVKYSFYPLNLGRFGFASERLAKMVP